MRSRLLGLLLGCGLAVAALTPGLACPYHATTASSDQAAQQTADAQAQQQVLPSDQ